MKSCWLIAVVGLSGTAVWAQPGDRNSIDIMVRIAGNETWVDIVDALPGQTVEVGVFYFRDRGYMLAGTIHNMIARNWDAASGDTATIVDNPNSALHPDGRMDGWNSGGQRQDIYTSGIDAGRMRISAFGNPDNVPVGGISLRQPPPIDEDDDITEDGFLGYRFNIVAGTGDGGARMISIDAPERWIVLYGAYLTPQSFYPTSLLDDYDGTDRARIHVVANPGTAVLLFVGAGVIGRRRRSRDS